MVRKQQIEQLQQIKATRDNAKVKASLVKLTDCARAFTEGSKDPDMHKDDNNLLSLAVEAARNRATLGEISDALETVFGRYKAQIRSFSGVYSKEIKNDESFE